MVEYAIIKVTISINPSDIFAYLLVCASSDKWFDTVQTPATLHNQYEAATDRTDHKDCSEATTCLASFLGGLPVAPFSILANALTG